MTSVFRIATMQAIKEIVEDSSVAGRFGHILTEESITEISKKVVDLFEMTLELRAKTQDIFGQASKQQPRQQLKEEAQPFPKTKNASEIYSFQENKKSETSQDVSLMPNLNLKLPRKRFDLSPDEKEKFMRR